MSKKIITVRLPVFVLALFLLQQGIAQTRHSRTSAYKSYKGLVMVGYQGWFNTPTDGAGRGWYHYHAKGIFEDGNCKIDLWPDVSEYSKTYESPFKGTDGLPARLFSSYDYSTTIVHFKWMKQYGIDGIFLQRFVTEIGNKRGLNHNDQVLSNVMKASSKYDRAVCVMYDLSGMQDKDWVTVINDWKHLVDDLHLTNRGTKQTYLYHHNKPLVALWGVGFQNREYHTAAVERIIDFLKNDPEYGNCSILLGVPGGWREQSGDAENDQHLLSVLRMADIINPWFVGRYNEESYPLFQDVIRKDIAWAKANQIDYVPTVFPGFSWHNMYPSGPLNQIPRNKGNFFWAQLSGAIKMGCQMLYVAMFDEIDEGTAIFKTSKTPPDGRSKFVTIESGIPNDYYLYLAGYAGRILKKEIAIPKTIPTAK